MAMDIEKTWDTSLRAIEAEVGENTFDLWFKPIKLLSLKDGVATLEIPNRFFKEWLDDYHPTLIVEKLSAVSGQSVSIKFSVAQKQDSNVKRQDTRLENRRAKLAQKGIYLIPKYTFKSFLIL